MSYCKYDDDDGDDDDTMLTYVFRSPDFIFKSKETKEKVNIKVMTIKDTLSENSKIFISIFFFNNFESSWCVVRIESKFHNLLFPIFVH